MKSLEEVKAEFIETLSNLNAHDAESLLDWIKDDVIEEFKNKYESEETARNRKLLSDIAAFSRTTQPNFEAVLPSETLSEPTNSREGLNFVNTAHVDAFLYDEADVESLTEEGKIPTHFCKNCGSKDCGPVELITHSCSRDDLEFIFEALLPDLTGKIVLDVGSRIGAVLFGASVFSTSRHIVGIEMNADLCNIAARTVQQFSLGDRVQVVNDELSTRPDIINAADVIILNNVFDWFAPIDVQGNLWLCLRTNIKKGALIIAMPSIHEALSILPNNAGIDPAQWVQEVPPFRPNRVTGSRLAEKSTAIKLYSVL